jgi:hypothetical protein
MAKLSSTERSRACRARKAAGLSKKRSARTGAERMRDCRARLRQARKAAKQAAKKAAMKPDAPEVRGRGQRKVGGVAWGLWGFVRTRWGGGSAD